MGAGLRPYNVELKYTLVCTNPRMGQAQQILIAAFFKANDEVQDTPAKPARSTLLIILKTTGTMTRARAVPPRRAGCQPAGLRPPLLLKTRATDAGGGGGSGHGLAVVAGWGELELRAEEMQRAAGAGAGTVAAGGGAEDGRGEGAWVPLVAQEYLPHSSALYKVCVDGRMAGFGAEVYCRLPWSTVYLTPYVRPMKSHACAHPLALVQVYVLGRHVCVHRRESLTLDVLERHKKRQQQGQEQQQDGKGCTGLGMPAPGLLSNISARPLLDKPDGSIGSSATAAAGGGAADGGKGSSIGPSEGGEGSGNRIGGDGSGGGGGGGGVSNAVLEAVAAELSGLLGLTMFNFDVVEPWEAEVGHHEGQDGGRKEQQDGEHGQLGGYAGRTAAAPAAAAAGRSHGLTEAGGCEGAAAGGGSSPHGAAVGPHVPCRTTLYVVDVNYFPGYDKLPGWEGMLAERLGRAVGRVAGKREGELRVGAAEGGLDGCGVRNGGQRGTMPRGGEEAAAGGGSAAEEGPAAKGTRC